MNGKEIIREEEGRELIFRGRVGGGWGVMGCGGGTELCDRV